MEVWKLIDGTDGKYFISNKGRLKHKSGRIRKFRMSAGYYDITIVINSNGIYKRQSFLIHRLVATYFIYNDDPKNKRCVNHIDGNKVNNNDSNLEWCTYSENHLHAIKFLGKKGAKNFNRRKTLIISNENGSEEILGIREAARKLNVSYQSVQNAIKKSFYCMGYKIELKNE